jgi:hypothetical protein
MRPNRSRVLAAAIAATLLAFPVASQQGRAPKTQVWIDVATHDMAGMPDMGGMGRLASGMFGGGNADNHYGATRYGGAPGQYVDIAMLNQPAPGVAAEQAIPAGMKLGKSLPLLPPKSTAPTPTQDMPTQMRDAKARILIYWGCGTDVRKGQPREIRIDVRNGQASVSGSMQGRYVPDRTVDVGPSHVLWPNDKHHKRVPNGASLVGEHRITGTQVPESLKFTLEQAQDFMPKIALGASGDLASGQAWQWQPVARAKGYFLHAMGTRGDAMVFWSSAETADAGMAVMDYLPPATVDKWVREKVLLGPATTSCAMPKGIFAEGGEQGGGGMLRMVAFGPETHLSYPPRPADPKAKWEPEWAVRVRTKSSTTAILGMPIDADASEPDEDGGKKKKRNLLRGILGG